MREVLIQRSVLPPEEHLANAQRLRVYDILDSQIEPGFEAIVQIAVRLFRAPTALISLLDIERQWFKSKIGMACSETPLAQSFCRYAVSGSEPMVVLDATRDPAFRDNPLVTAPNGIRFYAGAPIVLEGIYAVGTVCVIDDSPRDSCDPDDLEALKRLAAIATDLIAFRSASLAFLRAQSSM